MKVTSSKVYALLLTLLALVEMLLPSAPLFAQPDHEPHAASDTLRHRPMTLDERLLFGINQWGEQAAWLDPPAHVLSNTASIVVLTPPVALYGIGLLTKNTHDTWAGAAMTLSEVTSGLLVEGIKAIVQRPRPFHVIDGVRQPDTLTGGYSFPSGHAAATWGLATGLSLHYPKWYVVGPSFLYATVVSLSRPYLSVHYPSDIFIGAILGSLVSYLFYREEPKLFPNAGRIVNPR